MSFGRCRCDLLVHLGWIREVTAHTDILNDAFAMSTLVFWIVTILGHHSTLIM